MVRRLAGGRLHYAWIVAGVTFLALLGAAGFRATPGVLIVPLAVDFGWRYAAVMVTCGALLVLPVVALLMRSRPADVGLRAYGATVEEAVVAVTGSPIANAFRGLGLGVRHRDFWFLAASFFICGASTNGLIGTHLIPASIDHGLPEVAAASLLALIGVLPIAV